MIRDPAILALFWLTACGGAVAVAWGFWGGELYYLRREVRRMEERIAQLTARLSKVRRRRCFTCGRYATGNHICPRAIGPPEKETTP